MFEMAIPELCLYLSFPLGVPTNLQTQRLSGIVKLA